MTKWPDLKFPSTRLVAAKYHLLHRRFLVVFLLSAFSIYILILLNSSPALSLSKIYVPAGLKSFFSFPSSSSPPDVDQTYDDDHDESKKTKAVVSEPRIAVCLVGGARRFELTGPSIIDRVLRPLPNSDLFLHCPFDANSYKLSLLKDAPRIASVRIFKPVPIPEKTENRSKVLSAIDSPNGIQGLLQYFQLVEGCLTLIEDYETKRKFTYNWILRTRVDTYWSSSIKPSSSLIQSHYIIPVGSNHGGLNDRFGLGDRNTSIIALSRLSLVPTLYSKGFKKLNSEAAFKAQLTTYGVPFLALDQPFCVVSDRTYKFPLSKFRIPVAAISSRGPLNGVKCRPCKPACVGSCVGEEMRKLKKKSSWTEWKGGRLELCDARNEWESGWEEVFDQSVEKRFVKARKRVVKMKMKECLSDFKKMRNKTIGGWDTPSIDEICKLGLSLKTSPLGG